MLKYIFPQCKPQYSDKIKENTTPHVIITSPYISHLIQSYSIACEYDNSQLRCRELLNGVYSTIYFDSLNQCVKETSS